MSTEFSVQPIARDSRSVLASARLKVQEIAPVLQATIAVFSFTYNFSLLDRSTCTAARGDLPAEKVPTLCNGYRYRPIWSIAEKADILILGGCFGMGQLGTSDC